EVDGTTAWARADFSGAPAGAYDVEVRSVGIGALTAAPGYEPDPDNIGEPAIDGESAYQVMTARIDDAVVVDDEADAGRLDVRLSTPQEVRVGRDFDVTVTYENTGLTDIEAPVLVLEVGSVPGAKLGIE